jgi:hypothetical protein
VTTALTVYMTTTTSTTLPSSANTLIENGTTTTSNTNTNSNLATGQTGWGEEYSRGNGTNDFTGVSEPSPSAHGWIDDGTTLVTNQFVSGTWTGTVRLSLSGGSCTVDLHLRSYQRSSGGVYTLIAEMTALAQSLTTTQTNYICSATGVAASNTFATGDKLYVDLMINITASSSGGNIKIQSSSSATQGYTSAQVVTPGYQAGGGGGATHLLICDGYGGVFK